MLEALEEYLDHIDYGVFVVAVSPQLHFCSVNSTCLQILNCDRSITGLQPMEVLPIESAKRLVSNCHLAIATKEKIEYEEILSFPKHLPKNSVAIAIHLSPVIDVGDIQSDQSRDISGGIVKEIIGTVHYLSHKRLAELNRDMVACMISEEVGGESDAVIVVDREGIVRFVNRAAELLFNRDAKELEGEQFGLPIVTGERTEVDILRRDGQFTPAEMRVSETKGEDEIIYIVASLKDISVRKLAEASLRLRDRALAASSNGIIIVDAKQTDNPMIYVNPSFERVTGYKSEEVIGLNCRILQGSDRNQEGLQTIREALNKGQPCYTVLRNYRKDGTLFWVELWISPVHNELGELTNYIGIQNDITSRFLSEQERQESEEVLRTVLTAVKEGITFSDEQGKFVIFNQEMENLTGYSISEANASPSFIDLIHPEDHDLAIAQIQRLRLSHTPMESEVKIRTKSGAVKNVLVSTSVVSHQGKIMYLSAYRDITERKEAEEKLRQNTERERLIEAIALRIRKSLDLREILQNTVDEVREFLQSDRVLIYQFQDESEGKIVVESVLSQDLGIIEQEISDDCFGKEYLLNYPQGRVSIVADIDDPAVDLCHAEFLKRFTVKSNLVVPITNIDRVWGLLIAHQCTGIRTWKDQEITLLSGLSEQVAIGIRQAELLQRVRTLNADLERQVEERTSKLRQALVKEKELGEMKSRFVSMASHEFRTPLAIIQASSDLLKHYGHKISAQKRIDKLNKIQLEVRNMTELLEDVLTIGKIELGKLHLNPILIDLEKFCLDSIEEYKLSISFGDQIQFSVQNRDGASPENIFADPKLLRQVIINLLSNSIKYSNTSPKQVEMKLFYDLDSFDLEFIDHGIGIPVEDQSKIFESFYRAQNVGNIPGTGLGLAIAKASVELHRGKIKISSAVEVGTTITITIPYQYI